MGRILWLNVSQLFCGILGLLAGYLLGYADGLENVLDVEIEVVEAQTLEE